MKVLYEKEQDGYKKRVRGREKEERYILNTKKNMVLTERNSKWLRTSNYMIMNNI